MRILDGVVALDTVGVKRGLRCVRREMCSSEVPIPFVRS